MTEWLRKHVLVLVLADVLAGLMVFAVQGYQIHVLNSQQTQITQNSQKNDCWSSVLDDAITHPVKGYVRTLEGEARRCVRLP